MSGPVTLAALRPYRAAWALAELRGGVALPSVVGRGAWVATGRGARITVMQAGTLPVAEPDELLILSPLALVEAASIAAGAGWPPVFAQVGDGVDGFGMVQFWLDGRVPVRVVVANDREAYRSWQREGGRAVNGSAALSHAA